MFKDLNLLTSAHVLTVVPQAQPQSMGELASPTRERRSRRSRFEGLITQAEITDAYRGLGYVGALDALKVTPTEYCALVAQLPNREELLTITAAEWREMTQRGMTPRGVFTSQQTAVNLTLDVLCRTMPSFQSAHERNDIESMATLYRAHVIGYRARAGTASGQKAFFADNGLRTLLVNTAELGGEKKGSAAALLSIVVPGLIDASNPKALQPVEVERGYWNDLANVRRHFFGALDSIAGFTKARAIGDRAQMVALWKAHVCGYESVETGARGQVAFFSERAGLGGFLCDPHPAIGLQERGLLPLVKHLLPEMVSQDHELPVFARPDGFWANPDNVHKAVIGALYSIPGFQEAHTALDVAAMCSLYRKYVISYRPEGVAWGGQKKFFEHHGALEAFRRGADTLGLPDGSIRGVVKAVVPELFDASHPDHIRQNEVAARFWTPESMRQETLRALYTVPGFQVAHEAHEVRTMCDLYRTHVCGYRSQHGEIGGQRTFFWEHGLMGLIGNARTDLGFTRKNSPYELMSLVLPELFDPAIEGALSERELTQYYWSVRENAVQGVLEALYEVEGFREAHERGDVAGMADLYRAHVIGYRGPTGRNGQQAYFVEVGGLASLLNKARANFGWKKGGSPAEAIRLAVPELVDSRNPDALRRCEIEHYLYRDVDTAREAGLVGFFSIPGFKDAYEQRDVATMASLYRTHVIKYCSPRTGQIGQKAFLREVCGLGALLARPHPELHITKIASCAQVLSLVVPALTDRNNPDSLRPTELERGYWGRDTVREHLLNALADIPGFDDARTRGDIANMAGLYRDHVIGYQSANGGYGGQRAFLREKGRMPYIGYKDEVTGERFIPTLDELLNDAIPGIVDDQNDDALMPCEVTLGYWSDPDVAVRNVLRALYTVPGFKAAHDEYDIKAMAGLYREHVLKFRSVDGERAAQCGFFQAHNLLGIANHKEVLGIDKGHFFQELLELCVPGLVDDENPDALRPNEVSQRVWNDRAYVVTRLRQALYSIPGFQAAEITGDTATLASLYRTHVLQYKDPTGGDGGQTGFLRNIGKLWGGIVQARYHGHVQSGLSADLLNSACPGLVDEFDPCAVKPHEITTHYWTDEKRTLHLAQALRSIPGWREAESSSDVSALARLYRSNVLNFYNPARDSSGQYAFFASHRVPSVLYCRSSSKELSNYVSLLHTLYPALVDAANPGALHPQELDKKHWKSLDNLRHGVLAALYKIPGFGEAHRAGDTTRMVELYRAHVVSYQSTDNRNGGQLAWFTEVARMGAVVNGRSALCALGLPATPSKSVPAMLIELACPDIADAVQSLQADRHIAFVRGELFERLSGILFSATQPEIVLDRVGTRLEGALSSLYPDAIVAGRIIDFKWGRSFQNIRETISQYAEASQRPANHCKVHPVDDEHPVTIITLIREHSHILRGVNTPHRLINVFDLLGERCEDAVLMNTRRLLGISLGDERSQRMLQIFDKVRRLERSHPEDPDRNFYILNQLIEELADREDIDADSLMGELQGLDDLLALLLEEGVAIASVGPVSATTEAILSPVQQS